jgi:hypothetical protein
MNEPECAALDQTCIGRIKSQGEARTVFGQDEWRQHAEVVGRITLAWNHNVYQLLRVFEHLTGLPEPAARAIFFSHRSDWQQRRMIDGVAKAVGLAEADHASLKKLLKRIGEAADHRNLAAHTIFGLRQGWADGAWRAQVVPALGSDHDERLEPDFTGQFRQVERELSAIVQDLEHWLLHASIPDRPWGCQPFPGRPRMFANESDPSVGEAPSEW